jgi:hypothetical protein
MMSSYFIALAVAVSDRARAWLRKWDLNRGMTALGHVRKISSPYNEGRFTPNTGASDVMRCLPHNFETARLLLPYRDIFAMSPSLHPRASLVPPEFSRGAAESTNNRLVRHGVGHPPDPRHTIALIPVSDGSTSRANPQH